MIIEKLNSLNEDQLKNILSMFIITFGFTGGILLKNEFSPIDESTYMYASFIFAISAFFSILFSKLYFKKMEKKE